MKQIENIKTSSTIMVRGATRMLSHFLLMIFMISSLSKLFADEITLLFKSSDLKGCGSKLATTCNAIR